MLVLASMSATRRAMLSAAGVTFEVVAPRVDEQAAKESFRARGLGARDLADALAQLKATRVSASRPGDIVLGCDQTLECDDGTMLDKPGDDVARQLRMLSGRTHRLFSAVVAVENGQSIWRHVDKATLTMRVLSDKFIEDYAALEGNAVAGCVGSYRVEGLGAQLFAKIDGSHFTILGMPLLPLLDWLRIRGLLAS
jgi:septum formation protein